MQDDLLDAYATLDWAEAQIPLMHQRFIDWSRNDPYEIAEETDPETGDNLVIAIPTRTPDLTFSAETGAIINAIRSSLDLLAASLARRNGVKPSANTHFPIVRNFPDFIDPLKGIEGKKWLSATEIAAIKALKPYEGGDKLLWPFHHLDTLRKHERLVDINPMISAYSLSGWGLRGQPEWRRLQDKTILFRILAADLPPAPEVIPNARTRLVRKRMATKGNTHTLLRNNVQ